MSESPQAGENAPAAAAVPLAGAASGDGVGNTNAGALAPALPLSVLLSGSSKLVVQLGDATAIDTEVDCIATRASMHVFVHRLREFKTGI